MLTRVLHGLGGAVFVLVGAPALRWLIMGLTEWPLWSTGLAVFGILVCGSLIFFGLLLVAHTLDDPATDDAGRLDVSLRTKPKQKREQGQ